MFSLNCLCRHKFFCVLTQEETVEITQWSERRIWLFDDDLSCKLFMTYKTQNNVYYEILYAGFKETSRKVWSTRPGSQKLSIQIIKCSRKN